MNKSVHFSKQVSATLSLEDFQYKLANRVRELRLLKEWNQDELENYGISWKTVQSIEYGNTNIRVGTLLKLCEAFQINLLELLNFMETSSGNP